MGALHNFSYQQKTPDGVRKYLHSVLFETISNTLFWKPGIIIETPFPLGSPNQILSAIFYPLREQHVLILQ